MKLLTRLLRMRRPAGSVAEEAALSEIHMELLKEEYNTGELKLNIHRIPGTGIEVVVGENPTVMFTAHVDTVHRDIELQDIYVDDVGKCWAEFEGNPSVLGADDAAGIYILMRLIKANKPGLYCFFQCEEHGGIGSSEYADSMCPASIKQCISFDRKGYHDVITFQGGSRCASDEYATVLAKALNFNMDVEDVFGYHPCDDGVFTDSYNFKDIVDECTNISVGYFHEHTTNEYLDMQFLTSLADAVVQINFEELPIHRDCEEAEETEDWTQRMWPEYSDYCDTPLGGDVIVSVDVDDLYDIYLGSEELLNKYICDSPDVPLDILNYLDHVEYLLRKYVK